MHHGLCQEVFILGEEGTDETYSRRGARDQAWNIQLQGRLVPRRGAEPPAQTIVYPSQVQIAVNGALQDEETFSYSSGGELTVYANSYTRNGTKVQVLYVL